MLSSCNGNGIRVTNHWDGMIIPFFERLWQSRFLFTANGGGKWITVNEAVFNIFENEVSQGKHTQYILYFNSFHLIDLSLWVLFLV
jgi:hypothetical protein